MAAWSVRCRVIFVSGAPDKHAAFKIAYDHYGKPIKSEAMALHCGQPLILGHLGTEFAEPFATVDWTAKEEL